MEITNCFAVNYYVKITNSSNSVLIVHVTKETADTPCELIGKVLYFSENSTLEGTEWREKKYNLINSCCEFSKKGFGIPTPLPVNFLAEFMAQ